MRSNWAGVFAALIVVGAGMAAGAQTPANQVRIADGTLEGTVDAATGARAFRGVPYAQPPVGELRWQPPQPLQHWKGTRSADAFGPRAMQPPIYSDMVFRSRGMSEDCLYLNVWTPAASNSGKGSNKGSNKERLPVLVYFYGGGFVAGDASEPRYDGASMAARGIVVVTVNYRLGIFGFLAHPELTQESGHHASGNYGLLDQSAALQWVSRNIAAFGGDPKRVTIGGESAGSFSVSAQMASPLSKKHIAGAIGESGAMIGATLRAVPLAQAEQTGVAFAAGRKAASLAALRVIPAEELMKAAQSSPYRFSPVLDGYFLPKSPTDIYAAGEQARVPLLAGWNAEESGAGSVLGKQPATPEGFASAVQALYADRAPDALRVYHATNDAEARQTAIDLASDRFIAYGTWKWTDLHGSTSGKPVYRYLFAHPRPGEGGAYHSVEIEYALGNLAGNTKYAWSDDDRKVSATMQAYFANFIKTGDPNGPNLPAWPAANGGGSVQYMRLDVTPSVQPDLHRDRYLFLDALGASAK